MSFSEGRDSRLSGSIIRFVRRVFWRFLALNFLLLLPIIFSASYFLPDVLEIEYIADRPVILRLGENQLERSRRLYYTDSFITRWTFFEDGEDLRKLKIGFEGGPAKIRIRSISILNKLVLRRSIPLDGFLSEYECRGVDAKLLSTGELEVRVPDETICFVPKRTALSAWVDPSLNVRGPTLLILLLFEAVILLVGIGLWKIRTDTPWKFAILQSGMLSLHTSVFCCVIIPLQSIMANRSLYPFSYGDFLCEVCWIALGVFLVSFTILLISERILGGVAHLCLLAFLIFEYFETGILGNMMPLMDGEITGFASSFGGRMEIVLAATLFIIFVCGYHWVRHYFHWISLAFFLLSALSLLDVKSNEEFSIGHPDGTEYCTRPDILNSARFSAKRNVIVLVLDSTRGDMATDVVSMDSTLREKFTGFVNYNNNVGMGWRTKWGVPGMVTGQYKGNNMTDPEYALTVHGTNAFYRAYIKNGTEIYYSDELLQYGYASRNIAKTNTVSCSIANKSVFYRRTSEIPYLDLREVIRVRMTPYFSLGKYYIMSETVSAIPMTQTVALESVAYQQLKKSEVSDEVLNCLLWFHTIGTHVPMDVDRNGKRLEAPMDNYAGGVGKTHFVLKCVADLLDNFKSRGIYDKSMIVITADHGNHVAPTRFLGGDEITGRSNAMLWIKPFGATNAFETTEIPTSHSKIRDMLVAAAERNIDRDEIDRVLRTEERRYCDEHTDWYVDSRGKVRECKHE